MKPSLGQRLVGEFVGTFALVFAGCGAIMVDARSHALGHLGVALSFGLVIAVMISALGHISGAHFNPAVTAGFALGRHFPRRLVLPYWAAQLAGGVSAALLLRASLGSIAGLGATTPSGSLGQAFLWEALLSAFLMLVILAVATDTRAQGQLAALAIGGTVALDALFGGPVTGASMNPARSLAPAIAGGPATGLWIYLTAPVLGAAASTLLYRYLSAPKPRAVVT
jgi:aquaporin NIP